MDDGKGGYGKHEQVADMAGFGSHGGGYSVPPAQVEAGIRPFDRLRMNGGFWIPAFAGMTEVARE